MSPFIVVVLTVACTLAAGSTAALIRATRQLHTDELTALPNRRALAGEVLSRQTSTNPWSVILLDVDRFKQINDRYGHAAGDALLIEIARRLSACTDEHGYAYRLHGDEFALVLSYPAAIVSRLADRFLGKLSQPFVLPGGTRVPVSVSMGITDGIDGYSIDQLLQRADQALYAAKKIRGCAVVYGDGLAQPAAGPQQPARIRRARRSLTAEASPGRPQGPGRRQMKRHGWPTSAYAGR